MQLFRVIMVLIAAAAVVGQFLQERYRLSVIEKLPGAEGRLRYEQQRRKSDRGMLILTVVSAVVGIAAIVDMAVGGIGK